MDDENDCEVDRPDSASKMKDWQRLRAHQERERQWIAGVMRDLNRRTPRRPVLRDDPPPPLTVAAESPVPFSPAAGPSPLSPADNIRLQASSSPGPSRAGPLSTHTGPLSSGSWQARGDHYHSQPFLARTADGLSWLGGPDVGAATIGSSQSGVTLIGRGESLSYLGSSGSPVDVRSAGRGALGLVSPPSDRSRHEGGGGEEEEEEYSPPQPRAFWREEWHGGDSGGSGSRVSRGSYSGGSRANRSPRREESADLFGVDGEARDPREQHRVGEPGRFTAPAATVTAATTTAALRRLDRVSAEESVGDAGCRTRKASRDSAGGRGCREDSASRDSLEWAKSGMGRIKNGGCSNGRVDRFYKTGFKKASGSGNGSGGSGGGGGTGSGGSNSSGSSSTGVLSAGGFALLASVAIAAFAVGTLLAPRPPRERSSFPSAAPQEYARRQPSTGYEPTMVERRENRGKSQRAKLGTVETAGAASAPQSSTLAAEGSSGGSDLRVDAAASAFGREAVSSSSGAATGEVGGTFDRRQPGRLNDPAAGKEVGIMGAVPELAERSCEPCVVVETSDDATAAVDSRAASSTTCCSNPVATQADHRQTADARLSPSRPDRDAVTAAATAASLADADKPPRGKVYRGGEAFEPTARAASLAWDRDIGDPRWRRWRRARPPATQRLVVGVGPDAFVKTLGSAESSLLFLSDGHDRQARDDAWRVAASERAAATACKAMASSSVASPAPGGRQEDGLCDTGAAASKSRGGRRGRGGRGVPQLFPFFSAQGGTPKNFNQDATAAAASPAASSMAAESPAVPSTVAQNRGRRSEGAPRVPGVEESERGPRTPLASGGGAQLRSTTPPVSRRETSQNSRFSAAVDGHGRSSASPPLCSRLILSGGDVQASWAGRYSLALSRDGLADPGTNPSSAPPIETPIYFRERVIPSPPGAEEEWEERGQGTPDLADLVSTDRTDSVSTGRIDPVIPDRTGSVFPDRTDSVTPGRTDSVIPDHTGSVSTDWAYSVIPEVADSVTPRPTDSVFAGGEGPGGVTTYSGTPSGQTLEGAAPIPRPPAQTSGDQQKLAGPGVADEMLCLYWADASGGRWVLDDDLSLSNGVLGVTKDAAPASPYLAFPNHHRHQSHQYHHKQHRNHQHQHHNDQHRSGGGGSGGSCGGGNSGGSDSVRERPRVNGAGDGGGRGDAALSPPLSFAPSTWLLDSPRLQGWAEAEDVVVVCETD